MKPILLIFTLFFLAKIFAQNPSYKNINGFVFDKSTNEALIGATVFTSNEYGVVTDKAGYFSFSVPLNADTLIISFVGYATQKILIQDGSNINIYLEAGLEIEEVMVRNEFVSRPEIGVNRIQIKQIKNLPMLFGETDIIKSFQQMPGVQSGGEGKSELYVRGGSPDQNLILLDNVPLYYVSHFGGFFSIFNADIINDVILIKGGFPARYGSRLSSVLDITMRDGNMNSFGMQGTIGLLSTKIAIEAPIIKQKSSFVVSARSSLLPIFRLIGSGLNYSFYDINAKANFIINNKNHIFFSFYTGTDKVKTNLGENNFSVTQQNVNWGNIMGSLRLNQIWSNSLFSNLILYNTKYRYKTHYSYQSNVDSISKSYSNDLLSAINDYGLNYNFHHSINNNLKFKYGLQSILHKFNPNDEVVKQSGTGIESINKSYNSEINAFENAIYIESHVNTALISANIGLRYVNYIQSSNVFNSIEPRVTLSYNLTDNFSFKYGYSYMQQFVHLLSYSGTGLPSDYWMPSTLNIKPENSHQNAAGFSWLMADKQINFTTEMYYKTMDNLIAFSPGSSLSGHLSNWEGLVEKGGKGKNYGLEFFFQKTQGKTTGWTGLTISRSTRQFNNLNNSNTYFFKFDRLIDFSFVMVHNIKPGISLSGTWTYGSGYPVTLASEMYQFENKDVFVYDEKNSYRMNPYHRLDLGVNFTKKTNWGERVWNISILNVYNRHNPYFYYYERDDIFRDITTDHSHGIESVKSELKLKQFSLFSILPTFSYSFKF